jgi:hypothetical protein
MGELRGTWGAHAVYGTALGVGARCLPPYFLLVTPFILPVRAPFLPLITFFFQFLFSFFVCLLFSFF